MTLDIKVVKLEENVSGADLFSVGVVGTNGEPNKKKPKCTREIETMG